MIRNLKKFGQLFESTTQHQPKAETMTQINLYEIQHYTNEANAASEILEALEFFAAGETGQEPPPRIQILNWDEKWQVSSREDIQEIAYRHLKAMCLEIQEHARSRVKQELQATLQTID